MQSSRFIQLLVMYLLLSPVLLAGTRVSSSRAESAVSAPAQATFRVRPIVTIPDPGVAGNADRLEGLGVGDSRLGGRERVEVEDSRGWQVSTRGVLYQVSTVQQAPDRGHSTPASGTDGRRKIIVFLNN